MKTNIREGGANDEPRAKSAHALVRKVADPATPIKLVLLSVLCSACELVLDDLPAKQHSDASSVMQDPSSSEDGGSSGSWRDANVALSIDGALDAGASSIDASAEAGSSSCGDGGASTLYRDMDGDGFGDPATATTACRAAGDDGWVEDGRDCNDHDPDVHPEQRAFFGSGYATPSNPGGISFDYDCDGAEVAGPNQNLAPTSCVGLLLCVGGGYLPNGARSSAPGVNAYCGSNVVSYCAGSGLLCQDSPSTTNARYVCN